VLQDNGSRQVGLLPAVAAGRSGPGWPPTPSASCCLECSTVAGRGPVRDRDRDLGGRGGCLEDMPGGLRTSATAAVARADRDAVQRCVAPTDWIVGSDGAAVCVRP
jgi:hypothetical protein